MFPVNHDKLIVDIFDADYSCSRIKLQNLCLDEKIISMYYAIRISHFFAI